MPNLDQQLETRVAIVTGAGAGIGQAAALLLAQAGAKVAAIDYQQESAQAIAEKIQQAGGDAIAIVADIAQPEAVQQAVEQTVQAFGRLDIVFANAGINGVWAPLEDLTPADWDKTIATNLTGTFLTVKYAVPHLKQAGGSVIITSSVNGTRMFSNTGATAYACTKAAQVAFTKMVALELAKHKIRVNVICPGAIETDIDASTEQRNLEGVKEPVEFPAGMIPLTRGESGTSEQVAQLVLFLASDAASHISGTEIWIDGAQSLLQG